MPPSRAPSMNQGESPIRDRIRDRGDACPGALRLHRADDGALARLRVPAGLLTVCQALALADAAERLADGNLSVTSRGNIELRGLGESCGGELSALLADAGLLPSERHERVRNIVASPSAGLDRLGHADVQLWARELDRLLCGQDWTTALSGRFLFVLDDGRGDVAGLGGDVTLIAESGGTAQIRVGAGVRRLPGPDAPRAALAAAGAFLAAAREAGNGAWRVTELPAGRGVNLAEALAAAGLTTEPVTPDASPSGCASVARTPTGPAGPASAAPAASVASVASVALGASAPSAASVAPGASAPSVPVPVPVPAPVSGPTVPVSGPAEQASEPATPISDPAPAPTNPPLAPTDPAPGPAEPISAPPDPTPAHSAPAAAAPPVPGVIGDAGLGYAVVVSARLGRVSAAQWRVLLPAPGGEIRVTPWRGFVVPGFADEAAARERLRALADAGFLTDPRSPWLGVGACTGRPGCAKSLADVRADAVPGAGGLPVHWSGCERRCGHPRGDWVDVLATGEGRYEVSVRTAGTTAPVSGRTLTETVTTARTTSATTTTTATR
ncbi:cobalamin biosynthesis protein CobG [Streptomyces sp. NPDC005898]|uniref:cobalamin biosynthesis protein CobG n=1 Tax=Streptomyces sp. NPDC005898 TaxID=3157082 RepID=UPI0033CEFAFB